MMVFIDMVFNISIKHIAWLYPSSNSKTPLMVTIHWMWRFEIHQHLFDIYIYIHIQIMDNMDNKMESVKARDLTPKNGIRSHFSWNIQLFIQPARSIQPVNTPSSWWRSLTTYFCIQCMCRYLGRIARWKKAEGSSHQRSECHKASQ